MKKFMLMLAAGLALVACNTEKKDTTTTDVDTTAVVAAPVVAEPLTLYYATADGKQHFEMTFADETNRETMTLKDIEGNAVYTMEHAVSADGAKWQDAAGYYFWTKGENFYFGKGDEQLCEGTQVEAPAQEAAPVAE